jgi:hypothetical protein
MIRSIFRDQIKMLAGTGNRYQREPGEMSGLDMNNE